LQERAAICLAGNHDLVVLGKIPIDAFAGEAAAAARWTQTILDEAARAFLDSLRPCAGAAGAELFHGSPRHVALEISDGEDLRGEQATAGTELELGRLRRLLNPGSVGQPRDGDARAAWLEIDNAVGRATFRRTDYPVEQTQAEMREVGLPDALAARLAFGI
jgi:diadenosine tetraphosphatase ApaH/serine/threonine PP2A family protein phosphatase